MKKIGLFIALVTGTTLLGSCLKNEDVQPMPVAGLTMINAYIPADAVIYGMDGRAIQNSYEPLFYGQIDYRNLYVRENRRLEIYASGIREAVVDTTFSTKDSTFYTSFLYGTEDAPLHFITEDRDPENGKDPATVAAVRFYNLANTDDQITLQIGDNEPLPAFRDRAKETPETGKAGEGFVQLATGTYTLTVKNEEGETVASRRGIELSAGSYTTIFLIGDASLTDSYKLIAARQY